MSLTMAHSAVGELIGRRSLGKALLGARVLSADGGTPRVAQLLLRNLVKYLVVLVPPLAVVMLTNPNVQGLDDLAGRTVVVGPRDEDAVEESKDR
jgi:uncharacterized RDD family membrane protein YckC